MVAFMVPEDAVNIRESHDIDTNESWLVFRLASGALTLPEECRLVSMPELSGARVMPRFPQFARSAWSRESSYSGMFYLCPDVLVAESCAMKNRALFPAE